MTQIGRNDPCPCGSGKKYKACCALKAKSTLNRKVLLVGIATIAVVILLVIFLPRSNRNSAVRSSGSPVAGLSTTYTEIPGINLASLTGEQRSQVLQEANTKRCPCGCGHTVAGCRHLDTSCQTSLPLAQAMVDTVTSTNTSR